MFQPDLDENVEKMKTSVCLSGTFFLFLQDQFQFLYDMVMAYLDNFKAYANFQSTK